MVDRESYERVIETFMMEMTVIVEGERDPTRIPDFAEHASALRDPATPDSELLATAFAIVNEYVTAHWPSTMAESFRLYSDFQRK